MEFRGALAAARSLGLGLGLVLGAHVLGCSGGASPAAAASTAGAGGIAAVASSGASAGGTSVGGNASAGSGVVGGAGNGPQGGAAGSDSIGTGGALGGSAGAAPGGAGGQPNPEGVPADYQLWIDESFADAAALTKLRFADPADWVHQTNDGGYVEATGATYAPPHASLHSLAIFGDLTFGAFVLDAEVMQTNPSGGHRDFCVAWGMESPSRYYYAHIAEAHDAVAHNIHIVLDADRTAITKQFTPGFAWGTDAWHKLRVTRSPTGDMAVYADGGATPILSASDARLGKGYVGFGSFDDKGRVRNVKVWAPSADQAPAAFFTAK
jgi:hypothetical protein